MKKFVLAALCVVVLVVFAACGGKDGAQSGTIVSVAVENPITLGDLESDEPIDLGDTALVIALKNGDEIQIPVPADKVFNGEYGGEGSEIQVRYDEEKDTWEIVEAE